MTRNKRRAQISPVLARWGVACSEEVGRVSGLSGRTPLEVELTDVELTDVELLDVELEELVAENRAGFGASWSVVTPGSSRLSVYPAGACAPTPVLVKTPSKDFTTLGPESARQHRGNQYWHHRLP